MPTLSPLVQDYVYDGANRLDLATEKVGAATQWSQDYSYDAFGTRGLNVAPAQTFSATTNRISGVAGMDAPTYDAAGNLASHPLLGSVTYDGENRQVTFSGAGTSGQYVYDGQGRRVKRITGGVTTTYVYDAFGQLAAEYSSAAPSCPTGTFYRTTDHLGSTRLVTRETGAP